MIINCLILGMILNSNQHSIKRFPEGEISQSFRGLVLWEVLETGLASLSQGLTNERAS